MRLGWSIAVARIGGTEVRIHVTFLLLLLWIGIAGWARAVGPSLWIEFLFILLLFACVLIHEFGHVLAARAFGIRTPDITLYPIGGLARIDTNFADPRRELLIAAAGPAVSLVLAVALMLAAGKPPVPPFSGPGDDWRTMAGLLAIANLVLVLFNLLPVFPLDGGRMFRAALSWTLGRYAGTQIAIWTARLAGALFVLYGLWHGEIILPLIGVFVLFSASAEALTADIDRILAGWTNGELMVDRVATLENDATLADADDAYRSSGQQLYPLLGIDHRPLGIITRSQIRSALETWEGGTPLSQLSTRADNVIANQPAHRALALLQNGAPAVLVTAVDGAFIGLITWESLAKAFEHSGNVDRIFAQQLSTETKT